VERNLTEATVKGIQQEGDRLKNILEGTRNKGGDIARPTGNISRKFEGSREKIGRG
jgi:hypothetical protein